MRRFVSYILPALLSVCLGCATVAHAESMQIESDHLEIQQANHKAVFTGHVHLVRGHFELFCDRLVAYYNKGGKGGIERADAFGHVRMTQGNKHGKSDEAKLDNKRQILTLIGHAEMADSDGRVQGSTIVHNIKTNETVVKQGETGRVHIHIDTKDTGTPEKRP